MIGQKIGPYQIVERLGGGGMGVVYKAQDQKLGRLVALKFLPPGMNEEPRARARFVQEAQAASALDHPNICTIYGVDETPEGQIYIAMSYYDGETLFRRMQGGRLTYSDIVAVARQLAEGLGKAHSLGIVHRDVKPANIMISSDGLVKILDFGLARLGGGSGITRQGRRLGPWRIWLRNRYKASPPIIAATGVLWRIRCSRVESCRFARRTTWR